MEDYNLEEAAKQYRNEFLDKNDNDISKYDIEDIFIDGAKWQYEQFEKNRLAACDNMTKEEADREQEFVTDFLEKNLYAPTYSDAIEYGRKIAFEKAVEWLKAYIHYDDFGGNMEWLVPFENDECMIQHFKTYMEE